MKRKSRFTLLLLTMVMLIAFSVPALAAGKKTEALKAYKQYLAKMEKDPTAKFFFSKFGLAYLNNDSVPELVTYGLMAPIGKPRIYTYKKNQVVLVSHSIANTYYSHYYKNKCVLVDKGVDSAWDYSGLCTLGFKKGKLTNIYNCQDGKYFVSKGNKAKEITSKQASKLLKKVAGNTKATKIKYYKNTAKNRNKYLK